MVAGRPEERIPGPGLIIICWCATDVDHKYFSIIVFPAPVNNNWPRTRARTHTRIHGERERERETIVRNNIIITRQTETAV